MNTDTFLGRNGPPSVHKGLATAVDRQSVAACYPLSHSAIRHKCCNRTAGSTAAGAAGLPSDSRRRTAAAAGHSWLRAMMCYRRTYLLALALTLTSVGAAPSFMAGAKPKLPPQPTEDSMENLEIAPAEEGANPSGRMALGLGLTQYDALEFDAKRPNERDAVAAEFAGHLLRDLWRADSGTRHFYPILTAMPSKQALLNNHSAGSVVRRVYHEQFDFFRHARVELDAGRPMPFPILQELHRRHAATEQAVWEAKTKPLGDVAPEDEEQHKSMTGLAAVGFISGENMVSRGEGDTQRHAKQLAELTALAATQCIVVLTTSSAQAKALRHREQSLDKRVEYVGAGVDMGFLDRNKKPFDDKWVWENAQKGVVGGAGGRATSRTDRPFLVWSAGPYGYAQGQDIVLEAFKRFRTKHDDAVLLSSWHNGFGHDFGDIDQFFLKKGVTPMHAASRVSIHRGEEWMGDLDWSKFADENYYAEGFSEGWGEIGPGRLAPHGDWHYALAGVLRRADVGVFPTRAAAGGINREALRAMHAGVPVVMTQTGGNEDLLGSRGWGGSVGLRKTHTTRFPEASGGAGAYHAIPLVSHNSEDARREASEKVLSQLLVEELVDQLEWAYDHRDEAKSLGERGAAFARKYFTWEHVARRTHRILYKHLKKGRSKQADAGDVPGIDTAHATGSGGGDSGDGSAMRALDDVLIGTLGHDGVLYVQAGCFGIFALCLLAYLCRSGPLAISRDGMRAELEACYAAHNKSAMQKDNIEKVLDGYAADYGQLVAALEKKYPSYKFGNIAAGKGTGTEAKKDK